MVSYNQVEWVFHPCQLYFEPFHLYFAYSYQYETSVRWVVNSTLNPSPCPVGSPADLAQDRKLSHVPATGEHLYTYRLVSTSTLGWLPLYYFPCPPGCEGDSNLSMWIYVLLGNVLRGIGETPVQPLGISYIDDFASEENAALYVGKKNLPPVEKIYLKK